ncbi:hypothetical protein N7511_011579, partial (mitochondrion) [Penicillium nucicola]
VSSFFCSLR